MAESNRQSRFMPHHQVPWASPHNFSNQIASSATQRIQDLQYYVVQGLSPLISSSSLRPNTRPHGYNIWPRPGMDFQRPHSPRHEVTQGGGVQEYVINMDSQEPVANEAASSHVDNHSTNAEQANSNNRPTEGNVDMDTLRSTPEFQMFMSFTEKYIPFISILLIKLAFDHKLGILVLIGLFVTLFHSNSVVKREIGKQGKRNMLSLMWVILNLTLCITIIYTVLAEKGLVYALFFVAPYSAPISIWDVLWVVCVTDFVIRMITILIKLLIVTIPASVSAYHKKGKYYLFVERTSQLYRTIMPMQHWLYFFSESYNGPSKVFGVILSAAYLIFKCKSVLRKARAWKRTFFKVLQSKTYGTTPSINEIKEAGDSCPICQDDYKSPAMLQCKHIFCEDCVALWFDRERTCPICRAQIADDPAWRDGSTALSLQIF